MKKTFKVTQGKEIRESIIENIFNHKGFKCMVVLNKLRIYKGNRICRIKSLPDWRCAYVGLRQSHVLYNIKHNEINSKEIFSTNLTYSEKGDGKVFKKGYWWIGFDVMTFRKTISLSRIKKIINELANGLTTKNLVLKRLE